MSVDDVVGPIRVLILNWRDTAHPAGGGSERYVEQIADGLAARGHQVQILCAAHERAGRDEVRGGVRLRRRGGRLTVYLRALAYVARHRADVVVDVQNGIPFFSRLLARCPVVVLVHHIHREQWRVVCSPLVARLGWWIESWLAPRLYRGCRYVTVSEATRRELVELGIRPTDVRVVHNATDPPPPTTVARDPRPTLCVLSRLVPHKQVDHAIEVFARLVPRWPDLRLVVMGHGYAAADLARHAAALGVADRVELHGWVTERTKHDLLARSWVHLCPSLKEGWGRAIMEAAVHETPTVAYASAGGVVEAVQDGRTGFLVADLDEFTDRVERLVSAPELRDRMGRQARAHASTYTWDAAISAFARLVEPAPPLGPAIPAPRAPEPELRPRSSAPVEAPGQRSP